jgi:Fumarase
MTRISKENYYLDIAQTVLERATCLRRLYGAIIVKDDEIVSTGYNGAPRGRANCVDMNVNEVIAHLAAERGVSLHPNDQVNASQSSNDTFPSALHIAAVLTIINEVVPAAMLG